MAFVDAKVELQGRSLVIMDEGSGDCVIVKAKKLFDNYDPHENPGMPRERLISIFGEDIEQKA